MEMSPQFEQHSLFPKEQVQEPRFMPRRSEEMPETPYQQRKSVQALPDDEYTRQRRLDNGEHPVDVYHGGTYPMLMTGGEIRSQFQALDGDRIDAEDNAYSYTASRSRTATHETQRHDDWGNAMTVHTGSRLPPRRETDYNGSHEESDDELYDRKYREAEEDGLVESIQARGFKMDHPVSLSSGHQWASYTGGTGDQDRFQVLGGHHRVAVMSRDFPEQLLSVRFHPEICDARQEPGY